MRECVREYLEGSELCRSPEEPNRDGLVTPSQSDGHLTGKKEGKIEGGRGSRSRRLRRRRRRRRRRNGERRKERGKKKRKEEEEGES